MMVNPAALFLAMGLFGPLLREPEDEAPFKWCETFKEPKQNCQCSKCGVEQ